MEGASEAEPVPPASAPASGPPLRLRLIAIALCVVVALGGIALYLGLIPAGPTTQPPEPTGEPFFLFYEKVGGGGVNATFPLMVTHNPDNATVPGIRFSTEVDFDTGGTKGSEFNYTWTTVSDSGLAVRMVYDTTEGGFSAGTQWIAIDPGPGGWIDRGVNRTSVVLRQHFISYTVYRATWIQAFTSQSWLEVRYHLGTAVEGMCSVRMTCTLGYNATEPGASDLETLGPPISLHVDSQHGIEPDLGVLGFVDPLRQFHTASPGPNFDGGPYGTIRTQLRSTFAWGSSSNGVFQVLGLGDLTIQMYLDTRFGALFPVTVG